MIDYERFWATFDALEGFGMPPCPRLEIFWEDGDGGAALFMLEHDDEALCDPDSSDESIKLQYGDLPGPKDVRKYRMPVSSRKAGIHEDTALLLIEQHVLHWFLDQCRQRGILVYYRDRGCGLVQRHAFTLEVEARGLGGGELIADAALASIMMLQTQGRW